MIALIAILERSACIYWQKGVNIRAATGLTGVSKTTLVKLVADAGQAADWYPGLSKFVVQAIRGA
jgi:hypothetical protein